MARKTKQKSVTRLVDSAAAAAEHLAKAVRAGVRTVREGRGKRKRS